MNTEFDALEAELRSLSPREPSPELQRRIGDELSQPITAHVASHPRPAHVALAAAAIAASILALALFIRQETRTAINEPAAPVESPAAAAFDAALPSVWQFHQALQRPSSDLDALLDRHAARPPAPAISLVQIRGFGHSDSNLKTLLGEF